MCISSQRLVNMMKRELNSAEIEMTHIVWFLLDTTGHIGILAFL